MKKLLLAFILLTTLSQAQTSGCNQGPFSPVTICYPNQTKTIAQTVQTDIIYLCGPNSIVRDTLNPPAIKYRQVFVNSGGVYNYKSTLVNNQIYVYAKSGSTVNILAGTNLTAMFYYTMEAGAVLNNYATGTVATTSCSTLIGPSINCTSTGITEVQSITSETTLWPNPSAGKFYINAKTEEKSLVSLTVINQLGEIILTDEYVNNGKKELSLEKYPEGIYFVRLKSGNFTETKKVIITK